MGVVLLLLPDASGERLMVAVLVAVALGGGALLDTCCLPKKVRLIVGGQVLSPRALCAHSWRVDSKNV